MSMPLTLKMFVGYLLIVFALSLAMNAYGFARALPPYTRLEWAVLAIPKSLAFVAGLALLKRLKVGAFLWAGSVIVGWLFVIQFGFTFPALLVSLAIQFWSCWVLWKSWPLLQPNHGHKNAQGLFE